MEDKNINSTLTKSVNKRAATVLINCFRKKMRKGRDRRGQRTATSYPTINQRNSFWPLSSKKQRKLINYVTNTAYELAYTNIRKRIPILINKICVQYMHNENCSVE